MTDNMNGGFRMKKKLLALVLALALVCGLAAPGLAEGEDELTRLTLSVKERLEISDGFSGFTSSSSDFGVYRYWDLNWSRDDGEYVSATVSSDGTITSCYFGYNSVTDGAHVYADYAPALPSASREELENAASEMIGRILVEPETAELSSVSVSGSGRYGYAYYNILLNGVATETTLTVRIDVASLRVVSLYRSDEWDRAVIGETPSATPAVTAETAAPLLTSTLGLELRYVNTGDGITLRYVPESGGSWYVDAQTGELVDLSAVYEALGSGSVSNASGSSMSTAADTAAAETEDAGGVYLTEVELATVEQMASVLSADELDALLRAVPALGLDGMTQAGASYTMHSDTGEISCTLTYTRALAADEVADWYAEDYAAGEDAWLQRVITVNAADGTLEYMYTNDYMAKTNYDTVNETAAAQLLSELFPDEYASAVTENGARFVRTVNGCKYYANYINVRFSEFDGALASFSMSWDYDAEFPSTDGVIGMSAALNAYAATFAVTLGYVNYPVAVDTSDPQWLTYCQAMDDIAYERVLGYTLKSSASVYAIDAFTGEALSYSSSSAQEQTYTDCADSYARSEIEALAAYGIGFGSAEQFRPTAEVTQCEMLALLMNAYSSYYSFDTDSMTASDLESLYSAAYSYGLTDSADTSGADTAVTRLDFVKTLLRASVYGEAAKVTGVYTASFADAGELGDDDIGYIALAEGLGIIQGDEAHLFRPSAPVTREAAAKMLYNFMTL